MGVESSILLKINLCLICRTFKSVISVWMDTYPDDFRDHPDYKCLKVLEAFSHQFIPDSDLELRARHKIEKFEREAVCNSGNVIYRQNIGKTI